MKTANVTIKPSKAGGKLPPEIFEEINKIMKSGLSAARVGIRLGSALYIQKRNNLNEVFRSDMPGAGGACHRYYVISKEGDTEGSKFKQIIDFQHGARFAEGSTSGVLDGDLLEVVRDRLRAFQQGPYATEENANALRHIEEALLWMNKRTEDRAERGVLGTMQK